MTPRLIVALLVLPAFVGAQGVRLSGVTNLQTVDLRPFVDDSLPIGTVAGSGEWRTGPDGAVVRCRGGNYCTYQRSGARVNAAPLSQDLTLSAWGLMQGLSLHANVRMRTQLAGDQLTWPRANDHFDALEAFLELDRARARGRLGRLWISGGLGAYNFDGADLVLRFDRGSIEGFGGRALAEGLNQPHTGGILGTVDELPPDQDGYLVGVRGRWRPGSHTALSAMYQRVLQADRGGLYSERAAFDGLSRVLGADLDAALVFNLATGGWDEARLRASTSVLRAVGYSAEVRHSRPFFELWTIWGAFAPVGFDEARGAIDWRPRAVPFSARLHGGYRKYAETDAGIGGAVRTNGWRAGADARWDGPGKWSASGSYDVDIGFGASRNDGRMTVRWIGSPDLYLGLEGSALQNIYEFRVGTGRVLGAAIDGAWRMSADTRIAFDAGLYRQTLSNGAAGPDWTQRRASVRFEWTIGRDPGRTARRTP